MSTEADRLPLLMEPFSSARCVRRTNAMTFVRLGWACIDHMVRVSMDLSL